MPLLPEKLHSSAFATSSTTTTTAAAAASRNSVTASSVNSGRNSIPNHAAFLSPYTTIHPRNLASTISPFSTNGRMPTFLLSSVACNDGTLVVSRTTPSSSSQNQFNLQYRIFRPRSLSSQQGAPIVVLHGGPGVPSDYLYPLVDVVPYRSMVYFDQLGCGRSDAPADLDFYSISNAIDDLEKLIKKLGIRRFHLYGQSYGGILAFEYLKRVAERKKMNENGRDDDARCLSVILSSTPTSVSLVEETATRLLDAIKSEEDEKETRNDENNGEDDESDAAGAGENKKKQDNESNNEQILESFRQRHQCRTPSIPQPLSDAYSHAGTVWRGTTAIPDYVAKPPSDGVPRMPSAMIMRGEHDFVTQECMEGWKKDDLFGHKFVREVVLAGCAHHGLLENPRLYGDVVDSFFAEYD
uniref:AB hydrolase-1 domain-containing protein n=2 Tax=Ditylum brightwellii TaxID=49249 RepID=A0A7S4QWU9_9STRA